MRSHTKRKTMPDVIPPRSLVRLAKADYKTPVWKDQIGKVFRIGYYSPRCGFDVIHLVDEQGVYKETTDRSFLLKYFEILRFSSESDYFGVNRPRMGPIRRKVVGKHK